MMLQNIQPQKSMVHAYHKKHPKTFFAAKKIYRVYGNWGVVNLFLFRESAQSSITHLAKILKINGHCSFWPSALTQLGSVLMQGMSFVIHKSVQKYKLWSNVI
jgi:hypothetical protein